MIGVVRVPASGISEVRCASSTESDMPVTHSTLPNAVSRLRQPARRAFTLTELLTTVAIIVVLIGTLFVGISAATRRAQRAKTQFLMNSIAAGLGQFQTDFGFLPPVLMKRSTVSNGNAGLARDVTTLSQVGGGTPFIRQQNWFSYTTLADFLIGPGGRDQDGYGAVWTWQGAGATATVNVEGTTNAPGRNENPRGGIRHPGSDGCWGAIDAPRSSMAAFPGFFAARNPNRDATTPSNNAAWNELSIEGRVYGPYIDSIDERLIGGISGIDAAGNYGIVTATEVDAATFDRLPKCILDYWGSPIAYYRTPYSGTDLRSDVPSGVEDGLLNLGDVFCLRPWDVSTKETATGAADANGDASSSSSLKGASFALLSAGQDRAVDRSVRRDLAEFNKDNIVEVGK